MYESRLLAGRYRMNARIGGGGMGVVWRATDEVLHRPVAVKLMLATLLDEPDFERRFLFEARAMASLRHPGVVAIHDYRSDSEGAFLVMELVEGESLAEVLRRAGRLSPGETMNLVAQAADALAAAHAQGLVHRDVKPGNLLVRPDGSVVLTDFGIARATGSTGLTAAGDVLGTPSYLAPEQVMGMPATPLSDIYALGVVAYECLTGRRPFEADNAYGAAMKRLHEAPPPLGPEVSPTIARLVDGALARDPRERWQSGTELAAAAAAIAGSFLAPATVDGRHTRPVVRAVDATTVRPRSDPASRRRRRRLAVAAASFAILALVATAIWATAREFRQAEGEDPTLPSSFVDGFVPCGAVFCPTTPMCWDGTVAIGGRALPLTALPCDGPHRWETYAAAALPDGALAVRQDELFERSDIAELCSLDRMAERSRDRTITVDYRVDAWPVEVEGAAPILVCLAGLEQEATVGNDFRTGR